MTTHTVTARDRVLVALIVASCFAAGFVSALMFVAALGVAA